MHFLKSLLTLVVLSTLIFFIAYFLMPDVSESYFGISYKLNKEKALLATRDVGLTVELLNNTFNDIGLTKSQKDKVIKEIKNTEVQEVLVSASQNSIYSLSSVLTKIVSTAKVSANDLNKLEYDLVQGFKDISVKDFTKTYYSAITRGLNNLINGN